MARDATYLVIMEGVSNFHFGGFVTHGDHTYHVGLYHYHISFVLHRHIVHRNYLDLLGHDLGYRACQVFVVRMISVFVFYGDFIGHNSITIH